MQRKALKKEALKNLKHFYDESVNPNTSKEVKVTCRAKYEVWRDVYLMTGGYIIIESEIKSFFI